MEVIPLYRSTATPLPVHWHGGGYIYQEPMTIMLKQTRRNFLKMTTASAACLPFMKASPSATLASPKEQTPSGTVAVHLTNGDKRYAPSGSLAWQNADRARAEDTIGLRAVRTTQPILGFGAAFTDAACYV